MSLVINKLRPARQDLVDVFYYYARHGTLPTARHFLAQAEATFQRLARMPGIGTRYEPDEPLYAELRYFPVSRFRVYLVFYRPIPGGIEVLRVLHGARDIPGMLAEDFGVEDNDDDAAEREAEPGE
ncbi:MAG: type II toxin-antitoxin system RelE/ParE family toxin [Isosphaerales bacterium]